MTDDPETLTDTVFEGARRHLAACEAAYTEIGRPGALALHMVIMPLRDRYNAGERSPELYNEIMEISL